MSYSPYVTPQSSAHKQSIQTQRRTRNSKIQSSIQMKKTKLAIKMFVQVKNGRGFCAEQTMAFHSTFHCELIYSNNFSIGFVTLKEVDKYE